MSPTAAPAEPPLLVDTAEGVSSLGERIRRADRLAVDVEGNGLFAYRSRLCTVQLAWREGDMTKIAIVDTLAADVAPLCGALSAPRPLKVLHDLTFDVRMLSEAGARIVNAHDTTVFARFLGHVATGLAKVVASELGIALDKGLQTHDWSRRPLGPTEIGYLAGDVAHLLDLHDVLHEKALAADILEEIDVECAHRVSSSMAPGRDPRPPYARIKHAGVLGAPERSVLRELFELREARARELDVPPHRVLPNERLVGLAVARPGDERAMRSVAGVELPHAKEWLERIVGAVARGDVPEPERHHFEPRIVDVARVARRRQLEGALGGWRRREAERRAVSEQVVLPGHCLAAVVDVLLDVPGDGAAQASAIEAIPGIGARRVCHYRDAWLALSDLEGR